MSAADATPPPQHGTGPVKAAGKALHSSRLAGMAFMQRAAQRKQLQQRKQHAVRPSRRTCALSGYANTSYLALHRRRALPLPCSAHPSLSDIRHRLFQSPCHDLDATITCSGASLT